LHQDKFTLSTRSGTQQNFEDDAVYNKKSKNAVK